MSNILTRARRRAVAALAVALTAVALVPASAEAQFIDVPNPLVEQRADAAIYKHTDGYYYMTASVPDYKRVELRRSQTLAGLGSATPVTAFTAPSSGELGGWIWRPTSSTSTAPGTCTSRRRRAPPGSRSACTGSGTRRRTRRRAPGPSPSA